MPVMHFPENNSYLIAFASHQKRNPSKQKEFDPFGSKFFRFRVDLLSIRVTTVISDRQT